MPLAAPTPEEAYWISDTEDLILEMDSIVFPTERHLLYNTEDMKVHVAYHEGEDVYLFNDRFYLESLRENFKQKKEAPFPRQYLVGLTSIVTASVATRYRARKVYGVPYRTNGRFICDDRIPWELRDKAKKNARIKDLVRASVGDLASLGSGEIARENLDHLFIGLLASYCYREALPKSWLRPFILT